MTMSRVFSAFSLSWVEVERYNRLSYHNNRNILSLPNRFLALQPSDIHCLTLCSNACKLAKVSITLSCIFSVGEKSFQYVSSIKLSTIGIKNAPSDTSDDVKYSTREALRKGKLETVLTPLGREAPLSCVTYE